MRNKMVSSLILVLVGIITISFLSYAGASATAAPTKSLPEMLTEAGFKAYPAETAQEMAYMKTCPKSTIMIHQQAGKVIYCFAEPASNTMYMGDYAAYQSFQDLLKKEGQKIQEEKIESDPEFWNNWGHRFGGG